MESRPLYSIKQFVRGISLLAAASLTIGLGFCNLSMVPDLIRNPGSDGYGPIVWAVWIGSGLLAIGCAFSARATWRQIVAARQAQTEDKPQA